ncbi:MAG: sensor domain-containing diguanylate cyclase [Candidatus Manganitrophus sp.]|nr:sensor domain-containing diguanylate cyclase [Candidatus Manganitrophus sp.]
MISSFCSQAGSAVENIELQNQLAEQRKIMIALSNLTLMIDSPLYLHHLHNNILEQTLQLLQAEQGSLMVLDEFKNELSVKAMKGINRPVYEMFNSKPGEGIAGSVYETGVPLLVQDLNHDPRVQQGAKPRYRTPSFVSVPLKLRNRTLGVINLADKITGEVFSEEDLQLLQAIGSYISIAIERSELYEKTEELKRISITDALTGLLNRRYFQERLTEEIERSRRHRIPVSLIIVDIDNFKGFNDTFGHLGGDEILVLLGQALRNYIRAIDVAARYGGEEFTIILPQTNKEDARIIAERLCREIERNETLQKKYSDLARLTVSVGLATFPDDAETFEELIRNADRALYQAKLQGKNRVITFDNGLFS